MKLNEKRKVIEVLLCARSEQRRRIIDLESDHELRDESYGHYEEVFGELSDDELDALGHDEYWHIATEAAYRLIESSPTLRREWFGR